MNSGKIENFKGGPSGPKIIGSSEVPAGPVKKLDSKTKQEETPIEIRLHEESITDADQIRGRHVEPGAPEIRLRNAPTQQEWDRVKRLEDE